jgi:hypothetical protein
MALQQQLVMQQQQAMQMQAMRMQAMQQQQQHMRPTSQLPAPQQHQQQQPPQVQSPGAGKQYNFPGARKRPAPADFSSSSGRPMSNKAAKRAAASAPLVPVSGPVSVRPAANAEEAAEIEAWKAERRKHWPSAANTAKKVAAPQIMVWVSQALPCAGKHAKHQGSLCFYLLPVLDMRKFDATSVDAQHRCYWVRMLTI